MSKKFFNERKKGSHNINTPTFEKRNWLKTRVNLLLVVLGWAIATYFIFVVSNAFIADITFARGITTGSISDLQKAVRLNPNEEAYSRNLGLAYAVISKSETDETVKEELREAAKDMFTKAIRLNPQNMLSLKSVLQGYLELSENEKDLREAETLATYATELSPTDPETWYNLAKVAKKQNNKEGSKKYYEQTLSLKDSTTDFPPP